MIRPRRGARVSGEVPLVEWAGPVLTLAVCVYCYGILLGRLGYFQDDWHHVFYAYWQGAGGLQRFLITDRGPFAWPVYAAFFRVLGFSPAAWHWSLMIIRFLTAQVFWLGARRIWPGANSLTAWIALLFCVYPIFTLQPLAVAYTLHWTMFLVFMLSLLLMLEAQARPRFIAGLTAGALLLEATHLALIEYFAGLELARPVFLWLLFSGLQRRERFLMTARRAWPYLLILGLYAVYRSSFATIFGYDRFETLTTLTELLRSPLAQLTNLVQVGLQDTIFILLSQWYGAVEPSIMDFTRPSTIVILASILGFAALAYAIFARAERRQGATPTSAKPLEVFVAGLGVVVLSMLPFWLTGFSIYQKNQLWSERLALAAMPGASMLVVGLVFGLVERPAYRRALLSLLLGVGVGLQVQTARAFQASWDKQRDLYWQLNWRAPSLKPNTLLVSDQEILFFMGIYPTAFAINLLYPQVTEPPEASYWFNAGFEHMNFDRFAAGTSDAFEKYATKFIAYPDDVVSITFEPGLGQCLWVLRPDMVNAGGLTPAAKTWLAISNLSRIQMTPGEVPPASIFGREPERSWCYYFEKADLARQYGQWAEVRASWRQAEAAGLRAANGVELVPFIEAAARQGDWGEAQAITGRAQNLPDRSTSLFCDLWRELAGSTPSSQDRDRIVAEVQDDLKCQPWP
jgi:hypothetical protein